jgi:2',3'-cyclic-nucleotide 2'-phosphodiesterase (5'-nucleotidase family)
MGHVTLRALCAAAVSVAGLAAAEDSLYSSRLQKRFIDDNGNYNISFYHINDVHAHLDEFSEAGTACEEPEEGCYGGYSRIKNLVDQTRPDHPDSLFLNVGDEFQGTMYYTYYKGEKIAETLNQLGFDAMTLGNHEFDGGDDELGDFLQNLTFPIVSANIVSDNEKLNSTILPYYIFEQYQLAVIGVTTETTPGISSPGDGTLFSDAIEAVQGAVDEIRSTTNITRIAAITHIGYEEDIRLARETTGLYLIMGGHSHSLLGDMEGAEGDYPTIEPNRDGDDVFIVTAYRWGEYLGYIDVTYDAEGKILAYHGAPIHITNTTEQDADLQSQIEAWAEPFRNFTEEQVGSSNVELVQNTCMEQECELGDLISEALLQYRLASDSDAAFAIVNAGGIRAAINVGPITRGEVLTAFPFGNSVVEVAYSGEDIWRIIEGIVSGVNQFNGEEVVGFLQVSTGIRIEYNPDNEPGSRLVRLTIGDDPIDFATEYRIVTIDFLTGGGDNFFEPIEDVISLDTVDEVLINYLGENSPIDFELDGRISQVEGSAEAQPTSSEVETAGDATSSSAPTPTSAASISKSSSSVAFLAAAVLLAALA